jgi:hypothetical protein
MSLTNQVEELFKEAAEYFYESRGIVDSHFDTSKFKFYEFELKSLTKDRKAFVKQFTFDVYMNLKIYKQKLLFVVNYLKYVDQGSLSDQQLHINEIYLLNCDNLANWEIETFMKQIKPSIKDYQGTFGKPRKSPGRPREKTRPAKITQEEAAQLFYIFGEVGIIPKKPKVNIALDMKFITGWNEQDNRTGMNLKEGLSKDSKIKIAELLNEVIKSVNEYPESKKTKSSKGKPSKL